MGYYRREANSRKIVFNKEKVILGQCRICCKTVFEKAPIGIAITDTDARFLLVNPTLCKMLEYSSEELKSTNFIDKTHPEDIPISINFIEEAKLGQKDRFFYNKRYITKTGKIIWANVAISLLKDAKGNLYKYLMMIEDITKKVEAKNSLDKAKRKAEKDEKLAALGTMAAGIAHEINQPLNSIRVNVDSILYWYEKYGEIDERELIAKLKSISKEVGDINQIITNVKSFVHHREEYNLNKTCDLNVIINNVISKMKDTIKVNNIIIQKSLERVPRIQGNLVGLEGLVINLLSNAIQAFSPKCERSKEIIVVTFFKEDNIYLEISDNATGIDEALMDRVYDPFVSTKETNQGMGLGLTMVHWIVKAHNGQIEIENNNLGGVTCKVTIPYKSTDS